MREREKQVIKRFDRTLRTETTIVLPVVNMNGDSRDRLVEYRSEVAAHLRKALDAFSECTPNGRNFIYEHDLFRQAREQHTRRAIAMHELLEDLSYEAYAISDDSFNGDGDE